MTSWKQSGAGIFDGELEANVAGIFRPGESAMLVYASFRRVPEGDKLPGELTHRYAQLNARASMLEEELKKKKGVHELGNEQQLVELENKVRHAFEEAAKVYNTDE